MGRLRVDCLQQVYSNFELAGENQLIAASTRPRLVARPDLNTRGNGKIMLSPCLALVHETRGAAFKGIFFIIWGLEKEYTRESVTIFNQVLVFEPHKGFQKISDF